MYLLAHPVKNLTRSLSHKKYVASKSPNIPYDSGMIAFLGGRIGIYLQHVTTGVVLHDQNRGNGYSPQHFYAFQGKKRIFEKEVLSFVENTDSVTGEP